MKRITCHYNDGIEMVEVLPEYLDDGVQLAKKNHCGLRIMSQFGWAGELEESSDEVDLDLLPLNAYPSLPCLQIESDFKIKRTLNVDILYTLNSLNLLILEKLGANFAIDISRLNHLQDLRFEHSKTIANVAHATQLRRLHIWSYKGNDLTEFQVLKNLIDLQLIRPSIKTLDGIQHMKSLKRLDIAYAKSLTDISALDSLSTLEELNLPKKWMNR